MSTIYYHIRVSKYMESLYHIYNFFGKGHFLTGELNTHIAKIKKKKLLQGPFNVLQYLSAQGPY